MSLLSEAMTDFVIINKSYVDDGYGGTTVTWTEGATIKGAMVHNSDLQSRIAEVMVSQNLYTFTVGREIELDYHTVVKRVSDNKIFRLTSNSDDKKTPPSATLNMRQYSAEEFELK
jgi:hypothetical protein